jgi:hypothetical protein
MPSLRFVSFFVPVLCSCLVLFQTVAFVPAEAQQPSATPGMAFVLLDGTPVKLRISQTVSSADAQVNDKVEFEVLEDVLIGDVVVIAKGGVALGTVTEAQPKRRMARGGKLEIVMDSVRLVDGQKAALRAVKDGKGGGHAGGMTVGIVAAAIVFWPAAPLFLLMHGKDISFPKGTDVPTFINGDMKLDPARFQQTMTGSTQTLSNGSSSTLVISSTPSGAEIYLDQNFVGDTPSTVNAPTGRHSISVRKSGYKDWGKEMNLSVGSITLIAELEPGSPAPTAVAENKAPSPTTVSLKEIHNSSPPAVEHVVVQNQSNEIARMGILKVLEVHSGVQIVSLDGAGPAASGHLLVGDVITALNSRLISSSSKLEKELATCPPGSKVHVDYSRNTSGGDVALQADVLMN